MPETDISKKLFLCSFRKNLIYGKKKVLLQLVIKIKKHQPVVILNGFIFPYFIVSFSIIIYPLFFIFRKISKSFATIFSLLFFFFFRKISILFVTIFLLFSFFFFRKILIPSFFYNIQTTNLSTYFISEKISFI